MAWAERIGSGMPSRFDKSHLLRERGQMAKQNISYPEQYNNQLILNKKSPRRPKVTTWANYNNIIHFYKNNFSSLGQKIFWIKQIEIFNFR
ncbi:hypothetical protein AN161_06455 [Lysinibacillus sp. FJAT-14222]|nr:hypothetical protein AN161_06455 [Lysinibacillus sp. FJAT-14222]